MTHPSSRLFATFIVSASLLAAAACEGPKESREDGANASDGTSTPGAHVATLVDLRGQGGLESPGLGEGVYLGKQAPLTAGQRVRTPAGVRAEIAMDDGTRVRIDEQSELVMPTADAPMQVQTGRVIVVAGEQVATIASHGDTLEISRGRMQVEASPDARSWAVLAGRAQLRSGDQSIELKAGASLDTPLSPSEPLPAPALSLEPLHSSMWARDFEQARTLAAALPPGVGSLTARRPNTQSQSQPLRLAEQKVRVTIRGRVAHTEIEQAFVNDSSQELEGTYRFPLPSDASISGLELLVGNRWMEGAMVEKTRARRIFKSIVDRVVPRDPALFEWEQGNVFKLKIFPLPPHGERRVKLSYTQVLDEAEPGQLRYRYPMGGSGAGATEIGVFDFDVAIDASNLEGVDLGQPGERVRTPMMQLERRSADGNLYLHRRETRFSPAHELGVDVPAPRQGMVTHTDRDGQTYFQLAMRPEFAVPPTEAVDYVFVADRSHATAPELWTAASGLIEASLEALDPDDRFTVLACDTACDAFSGSLVASNADTQRDVKRFLSSQKIGGASDIGGMLEHASGLLPARSGGTRVVVYLGDGVPSSGELSADGLVRLARGEAMAGVRLEAVALGARADDLVLGALTEATGGDLMHAGISDDLSAVARELQFRSRVPALHDLDLQLPPGAYDVHPREVPPLRSGEELLVTGKLRRDWAQPAATSGEATLRRRTTGEQVSVPMAADAFASRQHPYLPRLWAAEEINWLTTHRGHAAKSEIVALSQDYTVMSRYTSLLALENDAMYRQYAVQRRGREKDRWRGELNLGASQLAWSGPATVAADRSRGNLGTRSGTPTPAPVGQANDPNAAQPAGGSKEGAWDFVGDRKPSSRSDERSAHLAGEQREATAAAAAAPTEVEEAPEEENDAAAPSADASAALEAKAESGLGKSAGSAPAVPAAEPTPFPGDGAEFAKNDAKGADVGRDLDRYGGSDKDQAQASSEAQDDDFDAELEDELDELLNPGTSGASGRTSQKSPSGPAKRPTATKKKKARKPSSSSPLGAGDYGGGAITPYDDTPMIARRPPRPKVRVKAAGPASASATRHIADLLRRRDAAPTDRARHRALVSAAMRAGDPRVATWAADWAQADPDHFRALIAHADALRMQGHPMAMRAYESAAEAHPFSDDLHRWLAEALEARGEWERACSHRRSVVSIDPAVSASHAALATCLSAAGRRGAAQRAVDFGLERAKDRRSVERIAGKLLDGSLAWTPKAVPGSADVRAELTFPPGAPIEVAIIDHRGRRLSPSHPEGIYASQSPGKMTIGLRRYRKPLYIEVTRTDGGGPSIPATLTVKTDDTRKRFDLQIDSTQQRVAYVYRR